VSDTGKGMTKEMLNALLTPYFRTKQFGKGAGLGLTITNHFVVEHGGWMEIESEPGLGSRFHLFVPRANTPALSQTVLPEKDPTSQKHLDGNETILLVDDEQALREGVRAMLAFHGYRIIEADDGAEAVEHFLSGKGAIDIVLMDIQMPRMSGWNAMRKIHQLSPRTPVILLSAGVSDPPNDGKAPSRSAGMMLKPFTSEALLQAIRKALKATERND
jgi:two-component system, cell cycle sensor histidine kinase and response regulator CckA